MSVGGTGPSPLQKKMEGKDELQSFGEVERDRQRALRQLNLHLEGERGGE